MKPLIRLMLADMIEELGHRVVAEAGNIQVGRALAQGGYFLTLAIPRHKHCRLQASAPVAEIIERAGACRFSLSAAMDQPGPTRSISEHGGCFTSPLLISKARRGDKLDPVDLKSHRAAATIMCMLLIAALANRFGMCSVGADFSSKSSGAFSAPSRR